MDKKQATETLMDLASIRCGASRGAADILRFAHTGRGKISADDLLRLSGNNRIAALTLISGMFDGCGLPLSQSDEAMLFGRA